jgi:hypothetical protein
VKLATFGEIASIVEPRSGQRLPIRYLAYSLGDEDVALLARCLLERVGDGGWARQLPVGLAPAAARPVLFVRMAALAGPGITFGGRAAQLIMDLGATAQWTGDLPIDRLLTPADDGAGLSIEEPPRVPAG